MNKNKLQQLIYILLAFTYICAQFIFPEKIYSISEYASYFVDLSFFIIVWLLSTNTDKSKKMPFPTTPFFLLLLFLFLASGIAIHMGARNLQFPIPFDLSSMQIAFLLLLVAPVLEELVFRYSFWEVSRKIFHQKYFPLIVTSILFSLSHLYAYLIMPEEFHNFIIYQAIYTLFLGLSCGFLRQKYSSVLISISAHGAFNLGFYLVRFL